MPDLVEVAKNSLVTVAYFVTTVGMLAKPIRLHDCFTCIMMKQTAILITFFSNKNEGLNLFFGHLTQSDIQLIEFTIQCTCLQDG